MLISQCPGRLLLPVAFAAAALAVQTPLTALAATPQAAAQQSTRADVDYRGLRASEVIGMSVRNTQGENIGQIEDMVVNTNTGKVRFAILSFDPGLFQGERVFAVPIDKLRVAADRNDVVLDASRDQLERAGIARQAWMHGDFANLQQIRRLDEAWNIAGPPATGPLARATELLGRDVNNRRGEEIGQIEELVLNAARGQVHYAVVNVDPTWLGTGKRVVLPLRAFTRTAGTDNLVVDLDKARVAALPAFSARQYADLDDRTFLVDVDRYLIIVPPASASAGAATGESS